MCGIAGLLGHEGEVQSALERMRDALRHRGPDAEGIHCFPGGGLAHTRLSVIDPSAAANQPFCWGDGRYHLVYNGELYNFRELRHELEQAGVVFHTQGDTEVLAAALATWGVQGLARLNGMFAFAWHDAVENSLLLARDHLGIKPLFHTVTAHGFAFASELGALLASGAADTTLDQDALDAYLALQYIPAPRTIYAGVRKLAPGHWLRVSARGIEHGAYWKLHYAPDAAWTLDTAAEQYRALLEDSVRRQCVSDVPLGAFLSGGLDSSSVVAVMAGQSERPVETFSIGFDEAAANELPYARQVAAHFRTEHHERVATPNLAQLLPELCARFGEPFADSSALPTWLVSKLARERVTVALSGDGGDELFAGYTWLHRTLDTRRAAVIPAPVRQALDVLLRSVPGSPRLAQARRFLRDAGLPLEEAFTRRLTMFDPEQRRCLLGRESTWRPVHEAWRGLDAGEPERMLGVDTLLYLPDDILTKVDRMSMAHALEVRVPLLDYRIVEFAATLPFDLKYVRGESKRVAKQAFRNTLPADTLRQRKRGFALPIDTWLRVALGAQFQETVLAPDAHCRNLIDRREAQALLHAHATGTENHGHRLWALLVLEQWLRMAPTTQSR